MTVEGVGFDAVQQTVVVLKNADGSKLLPVWIGPVEARAIQMELEGHQAPRPMTHDLMLSLIDGLNARVLRVVINDLIDSTFYATIDLQTSRGERNIDARPSDAIALAVRARCPIFVDGAVLEALVDANDVQRLRADEIGGENTDEDDEELERFRRLLED